MLEEYYKYKTQYKDYIIIIKSGNFFEILDKDALIVNNIMNYKLSKISDTVKCGFPMVSLNKFLEIIDKKNINYIIIENKSISSKKEYKANTYNTFEFDMNSIKYNFFRINKITKYLNENAYRDINKLLESMEKLING
ncbi:MAG: hypothetical protein IJ223_06215 [Clostridia bacterium]|nr:hypothetical protein [Clostridia bacterium]